MADMSDAEFASFVDRIMACRDAEDAAKADTKLVYAAAADAGIDKTALGLFVRIERMDQTQVIKANRKDELTEEYRARYRRGKASHVRVREAAADSTTQNASVSEAFDPETGEFSTTQEINEPRDPAPDSAQMLGALSQAALFELLRYDGETGAFEWIATGKTAGSVKAHNRRVVIEISGKCYYAHRLAWLYAYGEWPSDVIDHIDGDPSNNRIVNLRDASRSDNARNAGVGINNTSGHVGVYFSEGTRKWVAQIKEGGKQKNLGYFETVDAAVEARKAAEAERGFHENHGQRPSITAVVQGASEGIVDRQPIQPETANEAQHPVSHATSERPETVSRSGGEDSTVSGARTEATAVTAGETATNITPIRQPKPFRPNCLNRGKCGGQGPVECWQCTKAASANRGATA